MRHADRDEDRRRCGLCGKSLRPNSISVAEVGDRYERCFNGELAQRLGIDFDNTPIAPIVVTDVDGVRHRFEIRSMLVGTGHAMYAREVGQREARGGYRFAILGDREADAQDLLTRLRERIRHGLSVRHIQETEHGWQLTQAHRLSGVIEWDPETDGALPLLIVDGRTFTWDQIVIVLVADDRSVFYRVESGEDRARARTPSRHTLTSGTQVPVARKPPKRFSSVA